MHQWTIHLTHTEPHPALRHLVSTYVEMTTVEPPPKAGDKFNVECTVHYSFGAQAKRATALVEVTSVGRTLIYGGNDRTWWGTEVYAKVIR